MRVYLKNNPDKFHLDQSDLKRSSHMLFEECRPNHQKKKNNKMSSDMRSVPAVQKTWRQYFTILERWRSVACNILSDREQSRQCWQRGKRNAGTDNGETGKTHALSNDFWWLTFARQSPGPPACSELAYSTAAFHNNGVVLSSQRNVRSAYIQYFISPYNGSTEQNTKQQKENKLCNKLK